MCLTGGRDCSCVPMSEKGCFFFKPIYEDKDGRNRIKTVWSGRRNRLSLNGRSCGRLHGLRCFLIWHGVSCRAYMAQI